MSRKPHILIFTITNFSLLHGGILAAANIVSSIKAIPDMDVTLVTSWRAEAEDENRQFAEHLGLRHIFLPIKEQNISSGRFMPEEISDIVYKLVTLFVEKYRFLYERFSIERRYLDHALLEILSRERPDLIVINNIVSAVCVPSAFNHSAPCCFITHNKEVEIHKDFKLYGSPTDLYANSNAARWLSRRCNWISNIRFDKYVSKLYSKCSGIVALTNNDLPDGLPSTMLRAVLPPILARKEHRWTYQTRRSALYVGNISYFANRIAIEWICLHLAPELLKLDDSVHINIIGASSSEVPTRWQSRNVNLLGAASRDEVANHITSDELFIAPTDQRYGAKLKLAECAAHGTPFLATDTAMGGLPFLTCVPRLVLSKPAAAAHLILEHINCPSMLVQLSEDISKGVEQAYRQQPALWHAFIRGLVAK